MTRLTKWALAVILGVLSSTCARADPIFSYVFDQANYGVSVGAEVDVIVFFQETDSLLPGPLPNGYLASTGLFGLGVLVDYSGQPAQLQRSGDVTPNATFLLDPTSAFSVSVTSNQAVLVENVGLGAFVTAAGSGPIYRIEVGVFVFTGLSPGMAAISAMPTGSGGDNIGGDGTILDGLTGNAGATIAVTSSSAVPEPSSLILTIVGCLGLAVTARARKAFFSATPCSVEVYRRQYIQ